ncbi:MAG: type III-A CRISPR-associated RAMP protein Csm3, partial [Planctomycetaceae bacterium]|nr:type III-A CRISPR-associated RAMP protein Csm3 [Planctomycetaceae bacterium]
MRKIAHHRITGLLRAVSGLRIGGSDDQLEIGGTDLTCIKHPETLAPYVPGSSLKGRMRSELESHHNLIRGPEPFRPNGKKPIDLKPDEYLVTTIFGAHRTTGHEFGPTRIICRDAAVCTDYRL